jgi:hypothetical protein
MFNKYLRNRMQFFGKVMKSWIAVGSDAPCPQGGVFWHVLANNAQTWAPKVW